MRTLLAILVAATLQAVEIPTGQVNNARTSANTSETILTPGNVASGQFAKLGSYAVTGAVFGGMIYVPCGGATHGLIVPTASNDLYCFDASAVGSSALWHVNLGTTWPVADTPGASAIYYISTIGISSAPVADVSGNRLYVVAMNVVATVPTYVLYKLNLATGATVSSVTIAGTYAGLTFNAAVQTQRASLTLDNGRVYVCFGSFADVAPWHGWAIAYDTTTMTRAAIFSATVSGDGAGLWGASGGMSADGLGSLYAFTGNATYDGVTEWGESLLKWDRDLNLLDWFTPTNWAALNAADLDLASGRAMLVPGTDLIVGGAKDFYVYSIDQTSGMGHLGGGTHQIFITDPAGVTSDHSGIYGGTFINGNLYMPTTNGKLYGFSLTGSTFNTTAFTSVATYPFPGANLSSSSNGASDTIIWATVPAANAQVSAQASTLKAYNSSLTQIFSATVGGTMAKFIAPLVADGQAFVPTYDGTVAVFGLTVLPTSRLSISASVRIGGAVTMGGRAGTSSGAGFRRSITIDHLQVPNTDQTSFPVLVSGTYAYLATVANGGKVQNATGYDVIFTSDSTCLVPMAWETETWTAATGVVNYWVMAPTVSHTVDTVFYMCYGDTSISSFQGNVAGTWNSNYAGVFHLGNGTTLSGVDSTSVQNVALNSTVAATGQIDGGAAITSTHYLSASNASVYPLAGTGPCLSIWLKTTQTAPTSIMGYGRDTANNQFYLYFQQFSGSDYRVGLGIGAGSIALSDAQANDGAWHYFAGSVDNGASPQTGRIYMDGTQRGTGTFNWFLDENFDGLFIGRLASGLQTLLGTVDEARISRNGCSADQVGAEYNNQKPASTFYTVGAEVPL